MTNAVLTMTNVNKVFLQADLPPKHSLKNINLAIHPNDFIVVIGNNGAGKSTLLNTIAGNLRADSGQIEINHQDVTKQSIAKRAQFIARVFQDPKSGTASELTVAQNLTLAHSTNYWSFHKFQNSTELVQFETLLASVDMGLEKFMNTQVKFLSGGQRQVVSLLMATLSQPELLLLDEHTAALDPKTSAKVMELTNQLITQQQLTSLMITHNMEDALKYGNRLIMVQDGQITHDVAGPAKQQLTQAELLTWFN